MSYLSGRGVRTGAMAAGVACLAGHSASLLADDETIDLAKVPEAVKKAADKAVPNVKWTSASKENEDGQVVYELEGTDDEGRVVSVEVTAKGKVLEVEKQIDVAKIPKAVQNALKAKLPRFQTSMAFQVFVEGELIAYEFEGKRPKDKKEISVLVTADGKRVEISDDD